MFPGPPSDEGLFFPYAPLPAYGSIVCVFWSLTCSPSPLFHSAEIVTPGSKSKLNLILIHLIEKPDPKVQAVFDLMQGMERKDYGCLSYLDTTEKKGTFASFFPSFISSSLFFPYFFPSTWFFPLKPSRTRREESVQSGWQNFLKEAKLWNNLVCCGLKKCEDFVHLCVFNTLRWYPFITEEVYTCISW